MLGYEPPQPKYWKAVLAVAPFVALIAWSLPLVHIVLPAALVIGVAIPVSLIAAATVHFRMLDDWRAKWQIGVLTETREGAAGKQGHSEWH